MIINPLVFPEPRGTEDYSHWNYRVVKDNDDYKIMEVHYKKSGEIMMWADTSHNNLIWDNLKDLIGTYEYIGHAFKKPVLEIKDGKLLEMETAD